jgi:HTH-type transcriptional regulator, sugar sensing transcriptional regulator
MDKNTLSDLIRKLGFSEYETKCYLALFEKDTLTVSEAVSIAQISRTNAYEIMERLLRKGLAISIPGKVKQYAAAEPSIFQAKMMESVDDTTQTIERAAAELKILYKNSRGEHNPLNYIEIIKDPRQIHMKFVELSLNAKQEILVLSKRSETKHFRQAEDKPSANRRIGVFEKGVKVRCIYDIWPDEEDNKLLLENIDKFAEVGEEARIVENLPMRLAIFDSKIVMFMLLDHNSRELTSTVQIIEHPSMADGLKMLFESIWIRAEDYKVFKSKIEKSLREKRDINI